MTARGETAGFRVIRFWNNEVLAERDSAKEQIRLTVQQLLPHPPPALPLEGGGVNALSAHAES